MLYGVRPKNQEQRNNASVSEAERKRQKGVTTVEYAVMLVLIAIAVMIASTFEECRNTRRDCLVLS